MAKKEGIAKTLILEDTHHTEGVPKKLSDIHWGCTEILQLVSHTKKPSHKPIQNPESIP